MSNVIKGRWGALYGDRLSPMNVNGLTLVDWMNAAGLDTHVTQGVDSLKAWQMGEDPTEYRGFGKRRESREETEARDFPNEGDAVDSARQQGATHITGHHGEHYAVRGHDVARIFYATGKWHVGTWTSIAATDPMFRHRQYPIGDFTGGREAAEDAPVVYEPAAEAPKKRSGPLRWKRKAPGHYQAQGIRGLYEIKKVKPNRRAGINPWAVIFAGNTVRTFDSGDQAKAFAQALDSILSDPLLCPPPPARPSFPILAEGAKRPKAHAAEEAAPPCGRVVRSLKRYGCNYIPGKTGTPKPEDVYALLGKSFLEEMERSQEVFVAILYDVKHRIIDVVEIARGQKDRVGVGIDDVLSSALGARASSYRVAHDHPSFDCTPSTADKELTLSIWQATEAFSGDLEFDGHYVLGKGEMTELTVTDDGKIVSKKFTKLKL